MLKRINIFLKRFCIASRFGVFFKGTTTFQIPEILCVGGSRKKLKLPLAQQGIHWDFINIFLDDEYGLNSVRKPAELVYDIGGHIGLFSVWCRLKFPNATVKSFEPHPETFKFLQANGREFAFECYNFAVGSQNDDAYVSSLDESRSNCVTSSPQHDAIQISVKSLKDILLCEKSEIDLLKLDCEGSEWDIFQDVDPFQRVAEIRMEYHLVGGKTLSDLKAAAEHIGFEISKLEKNSGFGIAWMTRKGA
jgi:FkbM family methyltransferase